MSDDLLEQAPLTHRLAELGRRQQGYGQRQAAPAEAEAQAADSFSQVGPERGGHKIMLELRFASGQAKALGYAYLVAVDFAPDTIRLEFSGMQVTLSGRNLKPLFDALIRHRVSRIEEIDPRHSLSLPEAATVVTKIDVQERG